MIQNTEGYGHLSKECWHLRPNMLVYLEGRWVKILNIEVKHDWWYITLENGHIWQNAGYQTLPAVESTDDISESPSDLSINDARMIVDAVCAWRDRLASLDREIEHLQQRHREVHSPVSMLMIEDDLREKLAKRNALATKIKETWAKLPPDSFVCKVGPSDYFKYREKYPAVTPKTKAALWTEYHVDTGSTARVLTPTSREINSSNLLSPSAPAFTYAEIVFEAWMFTDRTVWCLAFEPITDAVYMQFQGQY